MKITRIENFLSEKFKDLNWHYQFKIDLFSAGNYDELTEIINLIKTKLTFMYHGDLLKENPFCPLADFTISGGGRTPDIIDLVKDELEIIERAINNKQTDNNYILAFFHDILGLKKSDNNHKKLAAKYFFEHAKERAQIEDNGYTVVKPIMRALGLLLITKDFAGLNKILTLVFTDSLFVNESFELWVKRDVLKFIASKYNKGYVIAIRLTGTVRI